MPTIELSDSLLLALIGAAVHGIVLLTRMNSDLKHLRRSYDEDRNEMWSTITQHEERLDKHEVRIARLEP